MLKFTHPAAEIYFPDDAPEEEDLATMGRRVANATFFESHATDEADKLVFAMDLTPLIEDADLDVQEYVLGFINRFAADVAKMIGERLPKGK